MTWDDSVEGCQRSRSCGRVVAAVIDCGTCYRWVLTDYWRGGKERTAEQARAAAELAWAHEEGRLVA